MMTAQTQTAPQRAMRTPEMIARRKDIPASPLYVTAVIPFLSGWGEAENKRTRGIYPVPDHETAKRVSAAVREKLGAVRVHVCATRPDVRKGDVCVLFDHTALL